MDEILLYLSLKYFGEWMAIYDSLQNKEELKVYDIKKAVNEVDADWITLISSDYPKNLKTIYKPPFGLFVYGKVKLIHEPVVTIYGKVDDSNIQYVDQLRINNINLLWVKKTNKEMLNIIDMFPTGNIFYLEEMKNKDNKTFQNILSTEDVIMHNAFCSEIWEKKANIDYSNQWQERMYLGLSLQALVVSELKAKELLSLSEYCKRENIKVAVLKAAYDSKFAKAFRRNKVFIIEDLAQITVPFTTKN